MEEEEEGEGEGEGEGQGEKLSQGMLLLTSRQSSRQIVIQKIIHTRRMKWSPWTKRRIGRRKGWWKGKTGRRMGKNKTRRRRRKTDLLLEGDGEGGGMMLGQGTL
jgi:hypothetical protein